MKKDFEELLKIVSKKKEEARLSFVEHGESISRWTTLETLEDVLETFVSKEGGDESGK